jgi:PEP-CTERM motif
MKTCIHNPKIAVFNKTNDNLLPRAKHLGCRIITFAAVAIISLGMTVSHARASVLLQYMQMPGSGTFNSPTTFTLPGYGNVQVTEGTEPATYWDQTGAYNQSAGNYNWGTDTQRLNVYNTSQGKWDYTVTFSFLNGAPDLSKLVVVPVGLASGTTARIDQQGSLVGEYSFGGTTSTTLYNPGTMTFSSQGNGDPLNTGWALFQLNQSDGAIASISLTVDQISGDGIGFTLGYANPVPEPGTLALLGSGVVGLGTVLRRRLL